MSHVDVLSVLRTWGRQPAAELRARMGVSPATLMRAVRAAGSALVARGNARRSTYAARRALRGNVAPLPLYRIDEHGTAHQQALLNLTYPDGSLLELLAPLAWPTVGAAMADGWHDGLPYPLLDMRPQGFLGRHFARAHSSILQMDDDPQKWSDDDATYALSLLGADVPGEFILGEPAYRQWLDTVQAPAAPLRDGELETRYAALAEQALQHGVPGSSAGGEFPKFTALRECAGGAVDHVIVKFSGNDGSDGVRRWSDLLVCEHLATRVMREQLGVDAAPTRIHQAAGRTFLEVVRFDRHGRHGRSGLISLQSANSAFVGAAAAPWPITGAKLAALGLLDAASLRTISLMWHFGRLIANTDMHEGNLSFQPPRGVGQGLRVAPGYDMLPMLYAPQRGVEVVARAYAPPLPLPAERQDWRLAAQAATAFWTMAADDGRISAGFRDVCAVNHATLKRTAALPAARG